MSPKTSRSLSFLGFFLMVVGFLGAENIGPRATLTPDLELGTSASVGEALHLNTKVSTAVPIARHSLGRGGFFSVPLGAGYGSRESELFTGRIHSYDVELGLGAVILTGRQTVIIGSLRAGAAADVTDAGGGAIYSLNGGAALIALSGISRGFQFQYGLAHVPGLLAGYPLPILGFRWRPVERLSLAASPLRVTISYRSSGDVTFKVAGRPAGERIRISNGQHQLGQEEALYILRRYLLSAGVSLRTGHRVTVGFDAGAALPGRESIETDSGERDTRTLSPAAFGTLSVRLSPASESTPRRRSGNHG